VALSEKQARVLAPGIFATQSEVFVSIARLSTLFDEFMSAQTVKFIKHCTKPLENENKGWTVVNMYFVCLFVCLFNLVSCISTKLS
jgi:hypothetical protein